MAKTLSSALSILYLLLNLSSVSVRSDDKELILVHILYRHGNRSPLYTFPTDVYRESYWPQGFGQLSQLGMSQQFRLGQYLRSRYIEGVPYHLLNTTYNRQQVYIRSSDMDRTLMSAYSNLAGMFPPSTSETWNNDIPWQPIAVHSVNSDTDFLRIETCEKGNKDYQDSLGGERGLRVENENKELFAFVAKNAGITRQPTLYNIIGGTQDALYSEKCYGLPLPGWVERVWEDGQTTLDKILDLFSILFEIRVNAPGVNRLLGGRTLHDIVTRMEDKVSGMTDPEDLKLYVYSAHDSTLALLLAAMNVFNNIQPSFAAAVMVELFNKSGQFAVEIWYKNDSRRDPYQLVIPGCNATCPIVEFIDLTKNNIPVDWQAECTLEKSDPPQSNNMTLIIAVSCIVILTLFSLLVLIIFLHQRRRKAHEYQPLEGSASKSREPADDLTDYLSSN